MAPTQRPHPIGLHSASRLRRLTPDFWFLIVCNSCFSAKFTAGTQDRVIGLPGVIVAGGRTCLGKVKDFSVVFKKNTPRPSSRTRITIPDVWCTIVLLL